MKTKFKRCPNCLVHITAETKKCPRCGHVFE